MPSDCFTEVYSVRENKVRNDTYHQLCGKGFPKTDRSEAAWVLQELYDHCMGQAIYLKDSHRRTRQFSRGDDDDGDHLRPFSFFNKFVLITQKERLLKTFRIGRSILIIFTQRYKANSE